MAWTFELCTRWIKTYLEIVMMLLATLTALLGATPASSLEALRKSVAFQGSQLSPDGKQVAYAGVVALMYFVLRQLEDYLVIPNIVGELSAGGVAPISAAVERGAK